MVEGIPHLKTCAFKSSHSEASSTIFRGTEYFSVIQRSQECGLGNPKPKGTEVPGCSKCRLISLSQNDQKNIFVWPISFCLLSPLLPLHANVEAHSFSRLSVIVNPIFYLFIYFLPKITDHLKGHDLPHLWDLLVCLPCITTKHVSISSLGEPKGKN